MCSCECAVAFFCPRNSISNVTVSLTIHEDKYLHTCETIVGRSKASLTEHHGKCLMCTSFVKLGFCFLSLSVSVSVSVCCLLCVVVVLVVLVVVVVVEGGGRGGRGEEKPKFPSRLLERW